MAKLVIDRNDTLLGTRFIERTQLTIGRAADNDIRLDDPAVSKMHAKIEVIGNDHIVVDLGSANGTLVNDANISRHLLCHNDLIDICGFRIRYIDHRSVVNGAGDRTMISALSDASASPPGLRNSTPVPAARIDTSGFPRATLRTTRGETAGATRTLDRPLSALGTAAQRAAILQRADGFCIARVEGAPPKVNGRPIARGWQPLADHDRIEIDGTTVQFRLG